MEFTQEELKAIREEWCPGANDSQFELFISEAKARNLRPGTHLFFMLRNTNEWDSAVGAKVRKSKATWITKIDAFRLISQRTGKDAGRGKTRWIYLDEDNSPSIESTIPLPHKTLAHVPREPYACVVPIYRSDYKEPIEIVCRFDAYAVTMRSGDGTVLTEMWQRRGPEQLEKCTESSTRRAAYPEEFGSLYLLEELKSDSEDTPVVAPETKPLAAAPTAPIVPKVNQTPAEPTDAPRPNEEKLPTLVEIVLNKQAEPEPVNKPKRKKSEKIPDNGNPEPKKEDPLGITQADIDNLEKPVQRETPEEEEQRKKEAQEFAEDVGGATPVPDRMPTDEQSKAYVARVRELVSKHGVSNTDVGKYVFALSDKFSSKELTVGNWDAALGKLDAAAAAGTLKELVKK